MSEQTATATEERVQERTVWAMENMPDAVLAARDKIMADWHPDQQPMSIWKAVNDAMLAAALGHEEVAGDRDGESAESVFVAAVKRHADKAKMSEPKPGPQKVLNEAMADWREDAALNVENSMAGISTNSGVCRLLEAEKVTGGINVIVAAKVAYGDVRTDQIWETEERDSTKLLARWKRNGDSLTVHAARNGECTIITAVVKGLLPVDLMKLLV